MGDSVARWEGDTLVVETTNFTDKVLYRGAAENLHLVERFTRVGPGEIDYRVTITDPDDVHQAVDAGDSLRATPARSCSSTRATRATTAWKAS